MKTKKDPVVRAKELFGGEDPDIIHKVYVSDCHAVKKAICNMISHRRVGRKDIFRVDSEYVISSLNMEAEKYLVYDKNQGQDERPVQSGIPFLASLLIPVFFILTAIISLIVLFSQVVSHTTLWLD